jgi:hypothetical protein
MREGKTGLAVGACLALALLHIHVPQARAQSAEDSMQMQQRGTGKPSREVVRAAAALTEAATTYSEIVEFTVTDRADAARLRIRTARAELQLVRPFVSDEVYGLLDRRVAEMELAESKGDFTGIGLSATDAFKLIATNYAPQMRRTPLELSMHTYSAFKVIVLASAPQVNWVALAQATKESEKSWINLRRLVRDTNLRVLLSEVQAGLRDAVTRNDGESTKFAARLQIGSVGVLRDFFDRMQRAMAQGRSGRSRDGGGPYASSRM